MLSSTDESDSDNSSDDEMLEAENNTVHLRELRKRKWKRKKIVTPKLAAALDRTKVSVITSETARSLGQNTNDFALNRGSIR